MSAQRIFTQMIDGKECTCIAIGPKDMKLSGYLLQGKKQYGYLYHEGHLTAWSWNGLDIIGDERCLCFDKLDIFPVWRLFDEKRADTLHYVRLFAEACTQLDDEFLSLDSGVLPIWRMYCVTDGSILILPKNVGDLITSSSSDKDQQEGFNDWIHYDIHPPFSLCDEFTQMLYAGAAGFPPLKDASCRECRCNAIPLSVLGSNLPKETVSFIDSTLHMSLTGQRDISGNQASQHALSWFLEKTKNLSWGEPTIDLKSQGYLNLKAKLDKKAARRVFWRKKGWIVIAIAAAVAVVSGVVGSRVKQALTPPYTNGMSDYQIIDEYYSGQTELDIQKMEASFAKHTKSPAELEVTNLFVTRQTRQAYEQFTSIQSVTEWLAKGKPAVQEGAGVYGITDISITKVDDNTYDVESIIWSPYAYEEDTETQTAPEGHTLVYRYSQTQRFTMETNKRDWRLISNIVNTSYKFLGTEAIETFKSKSTALGASQTAAEPLGSSM